MAIGEIRCPHCHRPTVWTDNVNRPFCSERCRLIDLGAWVDEGYRISENTLHADDEIDKFNK